MVIAVSTVVTVILSGIVPHIASSSSRGCDHVFIAVVVLVLLAFVVI
jgi:hypothetical protein